MALGVPVGALIHGVQIEPSGVADGASISAHSDASFGDAGAPTFGLIGQHEYTLGS